MKKSSGRTSAASGRVSIRFEFHEVEAPVVFKLLKDLDTGDRRRTRLLGLANIGATLERLALSGATLGGNGADRSQEPLAAPRAHSTWSPAPDELSKMLGIDN